MTNPINALIDASVHCSICGSQDLGSCDCFEHCSCGWWARAGEPCRNPETTRCTTKVKYGKRSRSKP